MSLMGLLVTGSLLVAGCGDDAASIPNDGGSVDGSTRDVGQPNPNESCATDADCVIAIDTVDCCNCTQAYTRARLEVDRCVVEASAGVDSAPSDCMRPASCEGTQCRCAAPPVRAICQNNRCVSVGPCSSHADCTTAADYESCCGGCEAYHVSVVMGDRCIATSQAESECAPPSGACDGLGCPSPPLDCSSFDNAVCMRDGTCREGGPGGTCPPGFDDVDGRCFSTDA